MGIEKQRCDSADFYSRRFLDSVAKEQSLININSLCISFIILLARSSDNSKNGYATGSRTIFGWIRVNWESAIEVRFDPGIEGARAFGSVRFVRRYIYSLICGLGHALRATGIFTWPARVSGASRKSPVRSLCSSPRWPKRKNFYEGVKRAANVSLCSFVRPAPRSVYRSLERSPAF